MVKRTFSHPYVSSMYVVLFLLNSWLKVHTKKLFSLLVYYVEKYFIFLVTTFKWAFTKLYLFQTVARKVVDQFGYFEILFIQSQYM